MDLALVGGELPKLVETHPGTGHNPSRRIELGSDLPIGRRPDVFRMSGTTPWDPEHQARIAGHRCRSVDEMGVEPLASRRKLVCQDGCLAEAADAVASEVAQIVG